MGQTRRVISKEVTGKSHRVHRMTKRMLCDPCGTDQSPYLWCLPPLDEDGRVLPIRTTELRARLPVREYGHQFRQHYVAAELSKTRGIPLSKRDTAGDVSSASAVQA